MFFLTFSSVWAFSYFFYLTYVVFVSSLIVYLIPFILQNFNIFFKLKKKSITNLVVGSDLYKFLVTVFFTLFYFLSSWVSPALTIWFSHLIFSSLQYKITLLIGAYFGLTLLILTTVLYTSSKEVFDFFTTIIFFKYWIILLFFVNNLFTLVFLIEILSTLTFLLLITSTFSSAYFYNNLNLSFGTYFHQIMPYTFIKSVTFYFWMSLLASLGLYFFLLLFFIKITTFDWNLFEFLFIYFFNTLNYKVLVFNSLNWLFLVFCIFLKCGIAPFFLWKPTFFKGLPFYTIYFYITFFYFFFFLYVILFFTTVSNSFFHFISLTTTLILLLGVFNILFIICESFFFKTFLAVSSTLNSLFVVLAITNSHHIAMVFFL